MSSDAEFLADHEFTPQGEVCLAMETPGEFRVLSPSYKPLKVSMGGITEVQKNDDKEAWKQKPVIIAYRDKGFWKGKNYAEGLKIIEAARRHLKIDDSPNRMCQQCQHEFYLSEGEPSFCPECGSRGTGVFNSINLRHGTFIQKLDALCKEYRAEIEYDRSADQLFLAFETTDATAGEIYKVLGDIIDGETKIERSRG